MTEQKNLFQRTYDALVESRMRSVAREVARYQQIHNFDGPSAKR